MEYLMGFHEIIPQYNVQILNGFADGIRVLNNKNEVIFVNDAMLQLMGANIDAMYCRFDNPFCNLNVTERSLETGEVIERMSHVEGKYFDIKTSPIKDDIGEIVGVIEIFRDITRERNLYAQLKEKNKNLVVEMDNASKIQRGILPKKGFYKRLKLSYEYLPQSELSGDMIDVFTIDDSHTGISISDMVGHGFSASMITLTVKQALRNMTLENSLSPALALKELSKRFSSMGLGIDMYFTCFCAVYNHDTNVLRFANAGHNPSPLVLSDGEIRSLEVAGFPISPLFQNRDYDEYSQTLYTGDKLFFMTDGITEATDEKGTPFSIERVKNLILSEESDVLKKLVNSVGTHIKTNQVDDMTCMMIEIY